VGKKNQFLVGFVSSFDFLANYFPTGSLLVVEKNLVQMMG
jgi:hypothetical protein